MSWRWAFSVLRVPDSSSPMRRPYPSAPAHRMAASFRLGCSGSIVTGFPHREGRKSATEGGQGRDTVGEDRTNRSHHDSLLAGTVLRLSREITNQSGKTTLYFQRWTVNHGTPISRAVHAESHNLAIFSITETESMEKLRPNVFWLKGRKSRHQLQINRENKYKMVPIPAANM